MTVSIMETRILNLPILLTPPPSPKIIFSTDGQITGQSAEKQTTRGLMVIC